jgi:hypothetical protein
MWYLSYVVSIRMHEKELWEKAKKYAKENRLTIGKLVASALEFYMGREDRILYELKGIREEISKLRNELKAGEISKPYMLEKAAKREIEESNLPSYFKDNPWIEVLAKRGKE